MSCLMEGCSNTKRLCKNTSTTFFSFPHLPAMRAKWIWACNAKSLPKKPAVCSEHFSKKDITKRNDVPRLNRGAFPLPPEGCYRRKIALSLGDNNTVFFKGSSGIIILNPNQSPMSLAKFAEESSGAVISTTPLSLGSDEVEVEFESQAQKPFEEVVVYGHDDEVPEGCSVIEEVQDLEYLDIQQLDDQMEEFIHTGSEDDEAMANMNELHVSRSANQYFKCCVEGCTNTSTNSDIKFYKFRTDEFSRSMWCEKIDDFKGDGNLKPYTVPSVNLPGGSILLQAIMPVRSQKRK